MLQKIMVIENKRQGNSLFDEMKARTFELYMIGRQSAYETFTADDELADALRICEDDYTFNLFKLDVLAYLSNRREEVRRKFVEQKMYIDQMDIPEKNKIQAILTSACILNDFGTSIINRNASNQDIYLVSRAMVNIELSSYAYYENLILYHFDKLVKLLGNVDGITINHIRQDKQYVKTENN